MSLAELERRLPAPKQIAAVPAADLEVTQLLLQSELPGDYLAFLARYGGGAIPGLLRVLDPASAIRQLLVQLDAMNGTRLLVGWKWGVTKDPGEFVPWAIADNATVLYFRTARTPAKWTVMLGAPGVAPKHLAHHPLTMTKFLAELLAGKLRVAELPKVPASITWEVA